MSTEEKPKEAPIAVPEAEKSTAPHTYLEIETKYDAGEIDRVKFKMLAESLSPINFLYVESSDLYFLKTEDEFLRYRMPAKHLEDKRSELTFKQKHIKNNNIVRTEVNLRIDLNSSELVTAFCEGLGYKKNFNIYKLCDIYYYTDAVLVYYTVIDSNQKSASFVEIEVKEELNLPEDQAWEVIAKYEKLLAPIGITPQKRKRLSLFEMYVNR